MVFLLSSHDSWVHDRIIRFKPVCLITFKCGKLITRSNVMGALLICCLLRKTLGISCNPFLFFPFPPFSRIYFFIVLYIWIHSRQFECKCSCELRLSCAPLAMSQHSHMIAPVIIRLRVLNNFKERRLLLKLDVYLPSY